MTDGDATPAGQYRVGAVVYHPRVREIWAAFSQWFSEHGLPLAMTYSETYDDQLEVLFAGELDTAWNTNLAHVQALARSDGAARALAMRDTDIDWRSVIVVRAESPIVSLEDLDGRSVGFGDADSPQAHIMPVHHLMAAGVDPAVRFKATRLDRDLGKHGDTGGAELAQLARVRTGELDAAVLSSVSLDAVARLGDADELRTVWISPPFHHCTFTTLTDDPAHGRFTRLLLAMDISDPKVCDAMQLEYVNRWVPADTSGYAGLIEAVAAGPVVVG
jgi:ABC-type phosphate/phosphonate transport system substrate-binding protein